MNTQTQNHEAFQDDLKAFLDGELSPARHRLVARHIEECAECRQELDIMNRLTESVKSEIAAEPLTGKLKERILAAAPAFPNASSDQPVKQAASRPRSFQIRWPSREFALLGTGFAVIAFLFVTSTLGKKVQTVFNVANNALSTGGGPDDSPEVTTDDTPPRDEAPASAPAALPTPAPAPTTARKVHKQADIAIEVGKIEPASNKVVAFVNGYGGYVASNNLDSGRDGARTATIEARVPVGNFDKAVASISGEGLVKKKTVTGEDITFRYSDAAQEHNVVSRELHVSEDQLAAALRRAEKRHRPGDVPMDLRDEVRKLRLQEAQSAARVAIARQLSELANITIQLNERAHVPGSGGFADSIAETGREAGVTFSQAARIPIACVIWVLAYSPLWLPLVLLGLYLRKLQLQR